MISQHIIIMITDMEIMLYLIHPDFRNHGSKSAPIQNGTNPLTIVIRVGNGAIVIKIIASCRYNS